MLFCYGHDGIPSLGTLHGSGIALNKQQKEEKTASLSNKGIPKLILYLLLFDGFSQDFPSKKKKKEK